MKYRCADDIYKVLHERLNATTLTGEEASLWFKSDPETQEAIASEGWTFVEETQTFWMVK